MKAVVLAAGKGTRLKEITRNLPKPMVTLGDRKLLEWILVFLRDSGIHEFIVVTGYLADQIEQFFGDGRRYDIKIEYIRQEKQDGTAGALKRVESVIGNQPFLMTFGDILASFKNYQRMIDYYKRQQPVCLVGVNYVDDPCLGAAVYFDESMNIQRMVEKPPRNSSTTNWNQAGIFIYQPDVIFSYIHQLPISSRGEYEITQAVSNAVQDGLDVRAIKVEGYRCEIGKREDLEWFEQNYAENPNFLVE